MKINVLYEDNHLLVINKPSGELSQGDKTKDATMLEHAKAYIKKKYNKPGDVFLGVVHRLDRPTSGILMYARTSKAVERLNKMFQEKTIQKTYWAVVKKRPEELEATLVNFLLKKQEKNRSSVVQKPRKGTKLAELSYKLIARSDKYYLVEVLPKTGRHHQIRVQLAYIGCPIKGDVKYGFDRANKDQSIHLHARKIEFIHPVKKEKMSITAPVPKDVVWRAFES